MPTKYFEVIDPYSIKKHGEIKDSPNVLKCVELLKKGDIVSINEFAKQHADVLKNRSSEHKATLYTVRKGFDFARKNGIVSEFDERPISYDDFTNLESVQYFISQLRGNKLKNLESKGILGDNGTKKQYVQATYQFNNWLHGKSFEFSVTRQIDIDTFKKTKQQVTLEGLEHLLKLYQNSFNVDSEFIKIVKLYLMDQIHSKCSAKYMSVKHSAIISYFDKNDSPLKFKYSPYNNHADYKEENENATITLDDVYKIIMTGQANPLEKAVILCRFHRGLDSSTFADRFNFQVYEQLVKCFGHSDFENWDLTKCPVPIRLSRVKTNYLHTGYLEHDAIIAIQEYLNFRYQSYLKRCRINKIHESDRLEKSEIMRSGKPLFVDRNNNAISINWITRLVPRLAIKAGIQNDLKGNRMIRKSEKVGHELRDLLKSTLIVSGCIDYVCQLAIGHKVGDSYEKQDKLYPEKSREEYAKASKRINIFSNVSNFVNNGDESEQLKDKIATLEHRMKTEIHDAIIKERKEILEEVKRNIAKPYDEQIKQNKIDFIEGEKKRKQEIEILENKAGEQYHKEKEVMDSISDMAKASGKSVVEMMSELIKSNKIKTKQ